MHRGRLTPALLLILGLAYSSTSFAFTIIDETGSKIYVSQISNGALTDKKIDSNSSFTCKYTNRICNTLGHKDSTVSFIVAHHWAPRFGLSSCTVTNVDVNSIITLHGLAPKGAQECQDTVVQP